ncbi:MAG: PQQ-binding-like beta-propeller repeat protein [candidate division Zixibacteria bacterium]|nr:PQQ-binding-like beta-propeller repeat protein [candidate division Zixibacteria bacterium]
MRGLRFFIYFLLSAVILFAGCSKTIKYRVQGEADLTSDEGWRYLRYDENNTGFVDRHVRIPLEKEWEYKTSAEVNAQILGHRDFILAGDLSGKLYMIGAQSGKKLGKMKFKGGFAAAPYLGDPILYFATDIKGSKTGALNYRRGKLMWEAPGRDFIGQVSLGWGILYTGEIDGRLTAWRAVDGAEVWKKDLEGAVASGCFLQDTIIYAATEGGFLYAFDYRTGKELFRGDYGATFQGHITSDGRSLYLCSYDSTVFKIDSQNGEVQRKFIAEGSIRCGVALAGDTLYVCSTSGNLYALDRNTLRQYFRLDTGSPVMVPPLITSDKVFVASLNGILYVIDRFSGENIYEYDAESPIVSAPLLFNGLVIFSCENRRVYAIR